MAKILIIGAGVIGSVYGAKLIKAGNEVSFLAKGKRLQFLQKKGLIVQWTNNLSANEYFQTIRCFENIPSEEVFDFVLVAVRNENLTSVYPLLKENKSPNIVFLANNPDGSTEYLRFVEKERIIIGFPGAGGEIRDGVVHGEIVSGFIQPTTFGQLITDDTGRLVRLKQILKSAGFPVSINPNMDSWLLNHLALVCPLGNAIYAGGGDNYSASKQRDVMKKTALALKEGFRFLKKSGTGINPSKFNLIFCCPTFLLSFLLKKIFNTKWANTVIANHAMNAPEEMKLLSEGFIRITHKRGQKLPVFEELASYN